MFTYTSYTNHVIFGACAVTVRQSNCQIRIQKLRLKRALEERQTLGCVSTCNERNHVTSLDLPPI